MTLTLHHLENGTFAAEVPTSAGTHIVFSSYYASDAGRESQYTILASLLRLAFGLVLPPLNETDLMEPGSDQEVTAKIA